MSDPLFWAKVDKRGKGGCWLWTGYRQRFGHGSLGRWIDGKSKTVLAHRHAWTLLRGPIPTDKCLLHHCDVPACVNPAHLYLGDRADNVRDKVKRGRHLYGETAPKAKLTAQDILTIRAMHRKVPAGTLAINYGVTRSHIYQIQAGLNWKHLRSQER